MIRYMRNIVESILWRVGLFKFEKISVIWFHIYNGEGVSGWKGYEKNRAHNKKHWSY